MTFGQDTLVLDSMAGKSRLFSGPSRLKIDRWGSNCPAQRIWVRLSSSVLGLGELAGMSVKRKLFQNSPHQKKKILFASLLFLFTNFAFCIRLAMSFLVFFKLTSNVTGF